MHTHDEHDEQITVLSGEFGLQIDNTRRICRAGEAVRLKPEDPDTPSGMIRPPLRCDAESSTADGSSAPSFRRI